MKLDRLSRGLVLALVFVAILWKGGKALDMTWALAGVAGVVTLLAAAGDRSDARVAGGNARSRTAIQIWLVLGFVALTVLSFVFSLTKNYGFDEVLQTASLALIFLWVMFDAQKHSRFASDFARIVSAALLLACAIGIAVYSLQPVNRFVGSFFDLRFSTDYWPNAWGEFVLLGWPLCLWTLFGRSHEHVPRNLKSDVTKSLILGLVFGCLFLSYSRGSALAFGLQLIVLAVFALRAGITAAAARRIASCALIVALMSIAVFLGVNHVRSGIHEVESLTKKVTFTAAEGSSSIDERTQFFREALELSRIRPWIGLGPYSFRFMQPHLQTEILATSDHPHNVFLKFAMERGWPASLVFGLIVFLALIGGRKIENGKLIIENESLKHSERTFSILNSQFSIVSVVGVLSHNLIDYNLQFVGIALPFWILLGLLSSTGSIESRPLVSLRLSRGALAILLLFFALYEGTFLVISSVARHAEARGDFHTASFYYWLTEPSLFRRDSLLSRSVLALKEGETDLQDAEAYTSVNSEDARGWRLIGDNYLKMNMRQNALKAYAVAFDYGGRNDAGILRALVYLLQDDHKYLLVRRHEFDSLLNDFAYAIEHNTHFIALTSNVEEVISAADLLAKAFPSEASAYRALAADVKEHAAAERAKFSSRPRGLLW